MSSNRAPSSLRRVTICIALAVTMLVSMVASAGAAAPSAATTSCKKKPTGEPVLVSMIASISGPVTGDTNFVGAAQAAVKSVNCDGGIQGRPLQLVPCNGNAYVDPNLGPNCAREAIAKGVVATAAMSTADAAVVQAFEDAGIPMVGVPVAIRGYTLAHSFVISAGLPGIAAGQAAKLYDEGYHRIRVMVLDVPGAAAIASIANAGLTPRSAKVLDPALVPTDPSADMSAVIQTAINGTDALILTVDSNTVAKLAPEIRAAGFKGPISSSVSILRPSEPVIKDFNFIGSTYPASAKGKPGIDRYNADMDRYAPKDKTRNLENSIQAWESVQIIADALQKAPTISASSLYTALQTYKVTLGVSPDIDFGSSGGQFGIPRIFTPYVIGHKIKNKQYVIDGDFFDPTAAPSATTTTTKPANTK